MSYTTINDAAVAFSAGKLAKADFVAFASERQWDNKPILSLMGKGLDIVDVSAILTAHAKLAAAEAAKGLKAAPGSLYFKVSEKGAISVYGLQKQFPVTLYLEQWKRLLENGGEKLLAFCTENEKHPAVVKAAADKAAKKSAPKS